MKSTLFAALPLLLLAACADNPPVPALSATDACALLTQPIPATAIDLPTNGATIESATLTAPAELSLLPKPPFSPTPPEILVVPATPEYCRVLGAIAPIDPKAHGLARANGKRASAASAFCQNAMSVAVRDAVQRRFITASSAKAKPETIPQ